MNSTRFPPIARRRRRARFWGLTVLVVEDSRYACEAIRLMCQRSGARIRRADCLMSARRHLQVYRPSVLIVDLGLPDGSGDELISEMDRASPRVGVILGMSGDDGAEDLAIGAGADGFLAKPLANLAVFQETILAQLPADRQPMGRVLCRVAYSAPILWPIAMIWRMSRIFLPKSMTARSWIIWRNLLVGGWPAAPRTSSLNMPPGRWPRPVGKAAPPSRSALARLAGLVQERLAERVAI